MVSIAVGMAVLVALFPFSGDDRTPGEFYSVFGYRVPTEEIWLSLGAGLIAGFVVWVLLIYGDED